MAKINKHTTHNKVIKPKKLILVITDKPITKRKTHRRGRTHRRKRRTHKKKKRLNKL